MKHRVLVVEDDPAFGQLIKRWLESEGHDAILADTLEAGFVNIAAEPLPDVVLLDIYLGKTNGLTLVHWARRQKHLVHIPIAAVTGSDTFRDLKSMQDAGCNSCFTKPIDFRALREFLETLVVRAEPVVSTPNRK
jgi:two-component system response regulator RegX3